MIRRSDLMKLARQQRAYPGAIAKRECTRYAQSMKLFRFWTSKSPAPESLEEKDLRDGENPFPDPVEIEITDVFDLHSIPPKQTKAVVEEYLQQAHARRFRYVRIIHGKGIGVQREMTRKVLANTSFVLHFSDAPPEAGGWGATAAELQIAEAANCEISDKPS